MGLSRALVLCVYITDHQLVNNFSGSFTCRTIDFACYKYLVDS